METSVNNILSSFDTGFHQYLQQFLDINNKRQYHFLRCGVSSFYQQQLTIISFECSVQHTYLLNLTFIATQTYRKHTHLALCATTY